MTVMFKPDRVAGHGSHQAYVVDTLTQMRAFIDGARMIVCGPASGGVRLRELMNAALGPVPDGPSTDLQDLARVAGRVETGLEELAAGLGLECAISGATEETGLLRRMFHVLDRQNDARMSNFLDEHLDLIALGTVADIVPLISENRVLVKEGLRRLAESPKAGIAALRDRCVRGAMTAKTISWNITPTLNSAGRRGKAHLSVELLLTDDPQRALLLLDEISLLNTERRELQAENMEKFNHLVQDQCDLENDKVLVVTGEQMEHGVTGIIASQILNRFGRPVILMIKDGDEAVGAARSIEGFDMVEAFASMSELLTRHGGHSKAAGLTLPVKNIDEFCRRMRSYAAEKLAGQTLVPMVEIDSSLRPVQMNRDLMRELEQMSPFGMGNQYPVFVLPGIKIKEHTRVGSGGQHLKLKIPKGDGTSIPAFGWGLGYWDEDIKNYYSVDMAVQLELVTWVDKQVLQLLIMDIRPTKI
jgi:single-stranded-DNA-specific exonuclease